MIPKTQNGLEKEREKVKERERVRERQRETERDRERQRERKKINMWEQISETHRRKETK